MKEMPKFKRAEPGNSEEKLIIELSKDLGETMKGFINLNKFTTLDQRLFLVLRDGALAYAGNTLEMLTAMMQDKSQVKHFLEECHDIFVCYLKQIEEGLNNGK